MEYNELQHWGVKGMKWGVRKKRPEAHEDYKRAHSKTDVRTMSDKELRETNNRLQMEKQYADLTKKKSKGKAIVAAITTTAGTATALIAAYNQYKKIGTDMKPAVDKVLDKIGDHVLKGINLGGKLTV